MVRYLPKYLTSVTCSSGTFKLKKITSELLAIPISRDAYVDHHRPPQPSNQRYRRLRWSKAANFTRWFEVAGATACLICHRQVGPFDGGSISPHFFVSVAKLSSSWPTFAPQQTRSHPFDTATRFGVGGIGRTRIDVYCVEKGTFGLVLKLLSLSWVVNCNSHSH
jgi:hypothetical protein